MTTDHATTDRGRDAAPPRPAVTLQDVADAAGVSKASASRALDPKSRYVSAALRTRVLEAADRLGYRPNASARATTTGATSLVAVLISDIRDPHNAEIVHGVIEQAGRSGMVATFAGTSHTVDDEIRVVRMMRGLRPRALILTGARTGSTVSRAALEAELDRYAQEAGRVVIAGDDELSFDTAIVPRKRGASALVHSLFALGYRSPAIIRPDHDSAASRAWEAGILEAADSLDMRIGYGAAIRTPMTRDGGFEAVERLLAQSRDEVDVLLAATDEMAIGAMSALRRAGIEPGSGVGVAGFEDVVGAEDVTPTLTSVNLDLVGVGAAAVDLCLQAASAERRTVTFEPRVQLRGTTPSRR